MVKRRRSAGVLPVLAVLLILSACQRSDDPVASPGDSVRPLAGAGPVAGPATKPGISLSDARLVLPAVGGRPGAAYFTLANTADQPTSIVAVSVTGAQEAQMHETSGGSMERLRSVPVPAHGSVAFAPGGRHVMVFGLPADLHAGAAAELTLSFADGGKLSAPLSLRAPGAGDGGASDGGKAGHDGGHDDMAGMKMGR